MKTAKHSIGHDTSTKIKSQKTGNPEREKDQLEQAEDKRNAQTSKKAPRKRLRLL